jgi:hypothetical protein
MTNKAYELEALEKEQALTSTIVSAMMQIKFNEWLKQENGADRLHDWFIERPHHYDLTHASLPIKEDKND